MSRIFLCAILFSACLQAQVELTNGASFRTDQAVAAGSWATAKANFAGVAQTIAAAFPLPKTLGGVTVKVDNIEAPVYFVSAAQINFLIPIATTPGLKNVQITAAGNTINGTVRVVTAAPGLFQKEFTASTNRGAVRNQDGV